LQQLRVFEEKLVTANQVAENELSSCSLVPAQFTGTLVISEMFTQW